MSLPNNFRLRSDLIVQAQDALRGTWIVKDPVTLRFFQFGGDEHFILQRLNGRWSATQILEQFARERAPRKLTAARLQAFLAALYRNGLACTDSPDQSALLQERAGADAWRESLLGWSNLLALRLPGVNPDKWLERIYPTVRWVFTWWFLASCLLVWLTALGLVVAQADAVYAQWPRIDEFLSGRNLVWLVVALAVTKILHELAHAITCKHFGGQCHELGVMLLVFTPCLYCNVTDAWMLKSRWQRIAISAAGILMELHLAALATIVWFGTYPGPLHSICLNIIVVCSVGTLLFNGNPLLKYDGYYILSDLISMPNLWQESRSYLYGRCRTWFFGGPPTHEDSSRPRFLLAVYALASIAYRFCLIGAILLLLYQVLHPRGFGLLWWLVVASLAIQFVVAWTTPWLRWWHDPRSGERIRKIPLALLGSGVAIVLTILLLVPLPCSVTAPAVVEPAGAARIYVATPGTIVTAVSPGEFVPEGQILVELENDALRLERLRIAGELERWIARVEALRARLGIESAAAAELIVAEEIASDLRQQLHLRDEELRSTTLVSPRDGSVISPPVTPAPSDTSQQLPTWTGTPLAAENRGGQLERGTLVCLVGDLANCEAVMLVEESDLPYLQVGQAARLRLQYAVAEVIEGRVTEIAEINAENVPAALAARNDIAVRRDDRGIPAPVQTIYRVRLALERSDQPRLIGARGWAKVDVDPQTIAARIVRAIRRTVRIDALVSS